MQEAAGLTSKISETGVRTTDPLLRKHKPTAKSLKPA